MSTYNPTYHSNIIANYRRMAHDRGITVRRTDEQLYRLYQDCYFTENCDDEVLSTLAYEMAHPFDSVE